MAGKIRRRITKRKIESLRDHPEGLARKIRVFIYGKGQEVYSNYVARDV